MKGTSEFRRGGPDDPLVQEIMRAKGLTEVPFYRTDSPKADKFDLQACMQRWMAYTPDRDGHVNSRQPEGNDPAQLSDLIREKGIELGGSDIGFAELTPVMINVGSEFSQKYIISIVVE